MINFSDNLRERLKLPLPGQNTQKLMMPERVGSSDKFSIKAKKGANQAAVLILLYKKNDRIYFPLTQRHEYDGVHSGQISFPGGKVDATDTSLEHTALRETEEEIGISQSAITLLGRLSKIYIGASNFNVQPIVGIINKIPDFTIDTHEVAEIVEIAIEQLLDSSLIGKEMLIIKNKFKIDAPYFDFNGHHVWGATAMMLAEFKEVLKSV